MSDFVFDHLRAERTGIPEAVLASGKSVEQIAAIAANVLDTGASLFVTRLAPDKAAALGHFGAALHYHPGSATAVFSAAPPPEPDTRGAAVVAAGTSDLSVAREAVQTLRYLGIGSRLIVDVGVAGLWRLLDRVEDIRAEPVVIAVAGMEGALFSVLAGLVDAPVIAVPTSVGYGVAEGGRAALSSALASCAPGVLTVNIDNGYGAAVSAVKILRVARHRQSG
jgi:NCAIR mutase (PurE)-related protein